MPRNKKSEDNGSNENLPSRRDNGDSFRQLFDEDFWEPLTSWRGPRLLPALDRHWFPRVDISETGSEVTVRADVPGIEAENLEINVDDNRLTLSGRTERESKSGERPYRYERVCGEFRREFSLPARVKQSGTKAVYKNGVLTVTLPKAKDESQNKITIEKQ